MNFVKSAKQKSNDFFSFFLSSDDFYRLQPCAFSSCRAAAAGIPCSMPETLYPAMHSSLWNLKKRSVILRT